MYYNVMYMYMYMYMTNFEYLNEMLRLLELGYFVYNRVDGDILSFRFLATH